MISKRTREQAALICAVAASELYWQYAYWIGSALGLPVAASDLAEKAICACRQAHPNPIDWRARRAEAEALLLTGWTP